MRKVILPIVCASLLSAGGAFAQWRQPVSSKTIGDSILPLPPVTDCYRNCGDGLDAERDWANTAGNTDFNSTTSWSAGVVPTAGDVAWFKAAEVVNPNLSSSVSIAGLYFNGTTSSGYDVTSSNSGVVFTLTGVGTTGNGGTSNSSAAAVRSEITSGTNTIDAPLNLGAAAAATQVLFQSAGGTLVINGVISSTNAVTLSMKGTGTIQLNGANTFTSGSNINDAGTVLVVGNDSALGTGTFTMSSSGFLQAGGGTRTLANAIVLGGNTTISGTNAFIFNGTTTSSGSNSRSLTVNNTGGVTMNGNVFLSESDSTPRSLLINGSSNVTINGVVANNNVGNTLASPLKYSGTGILTLNNANTYSGGTSLNLAGGTIVANHDGAFGTGNITLTVAAVTLTLQNGATNNYIADTANLSLLTGNTVNLSFNGTDTINELVINGVVQPAGTYNNSNEASLLFGNGNLVVLIPEPSTWMMLALGAGLLLSVQRFRRKLQ